MYTSTSADAAADSATVTSALLSASDAITILSANATVASGARGVADTMSDKAPPRLPAKARIWKS